MLNHNFFPYARYTQNAFRLCLHIVSDLVVAKLEAVSKHLGNFYCSLDYYWPHCAWARCHHYETEFTISGGDVVLIPGLLPIFLQGGRGPFCLFRYALPTRTSYVSRTLHADRSGHPAVFHNPPITHNPSIIGKMAQDILMM